MIYFLSYIVYLYMHGQILSNLVGKEGSNAECSLMI